ncbi:MAG: integrase family protein [Alphaproteobacteria bacterium]|nr:integrase family protein [Alphaproteobacteria bacterium]
MKLTKTEVERMPLTENGQKLYFDTELKGFGLLVSRQSKSYIAQKDIRGKSRRVNIGRHGTWTTDEARKEARKILASMDSGQDPVEIQTAKLMTNITLLSCYQIHKDLLKRKDAAEGTLNNYQFTMDNYLKDWWDRPIDKISRSEVRERHTLIGEKHGHVVANRAMQNFRAIYNTAMKEYEHLPPCPIIAVHWFKERRRQEPIPADKLPAWFNLTKKIKNPVRRDYQLFVLFTGIRRRDAASIRWEDIDLTKASLHRPKPKGGEDRAFTIPLPDICLEILERRERQNRILFGDNCPWVFPTFSRKGNKLIPVQEPKEQRQGLPSPHRLRDTYTTAANNAGLSPYDIDVLTNHRPAKGSVTAGYIRQDFEYLRVQQQKVADYLKLHLKMCEKDSLGQCRNEKN